VEPDSRPSDGHLTPSGVKRLTETLLHHHRLADPNLAARRHAPFRAFATQFRLAKPTLPPDATQVQWPLPLSWDPTTWQGPPHDARRHTSSAMLPVS